MRNLTKTLAVLSLLAPASAYPLGIGDIKLHSALNQNLNAEISLILSPGEKVSDIKVNLAPPDKFDEAGVPWNYFLSKIKFDPVVRSDGSVVIKVSSKEALKEPFLGLLLQVSWPKGSLYREFSVLVDPPEVYEQATIPVISLPNRDETVTARSYEQPRERVATPLQRKSRKSTKVAGNYGPTRRNDTLWNIAEPASRQRKVSVEQMMIAIYRENPKAFFKDNINALQTGEVLRLPNREAILKLSRKQALAEYTRHVDAWKNRSGIASLPTDASIETAAKDEKVPVTQLTLAAPSESSVSENAVITPGQEQGARSSSKVSDASEASSSAKSPQNDALQTKITELQTQLAKMQELLAVKDQQLAALQSQAETESTTKSEVSQPLPAQAKSAEQVLPETSPQPAKQTPAPAPVEAVSTPPVQATPTPPKPVTTPVTKKPAQPVKAKIKPVPLSKSESSVEHDSGMDSIYMTVGSISIGVLSILGLLWWRKRKIDAKTDTESMFAPSTVYNQNELDVSPTPINPAPFDEGDAYSVDPVGESSFLSEFTPSDFDAFDTDQGEIDPVSEADVYLAYGRYQQAEELMRNAIAEQPDRDECKIKLLEIYYANENKKAFEDYATELAASGKNANKAFWDKVTEMGREICPDLLIFSSGTSPVSEKDNNQREVPDSSVTLVKKDDDSGLNQIPDGMDFGLGVFDDSLSNDINTEAPIFDNDIFDFEDSLSKDEENKNNESIEFDLGSFSSSSETEYSEFEQIEEMSSDESESSDNDDKSYDFESFDFNLDNEQQFENKAEISGIENTAIQADSNDTSEDEFTLDGDFNFDFDLSQSEEDQEDDVSGVSDLTDMDEFETKLDLAKAYLDMGDETSAKDILGEVLEKGSDEQKHIAGKLLDDLS